MRQVSPSLWTLALYALGWSPGPMSSLEPRRVPPHLSIYHRHIQTAQLCLLVQLKGKLPAPWRASQGHSHSRCCLPLPENEASRLHKCETEFPLNQPGFSASPAPQHHSPALLPSAGPSLPDLISPTEIVWVLTAQDNWKCL